MPEVVAVNTELLGICRNCLPISEAPGDNWIGGVGTGAYGAVKMALKHPETFSRAVAINGVLDMEAVIAKALAGEDTGICHSKASLEAVFGDLAAFPGSENDLYALAAKGTGSRFCFLWEQDAGVAEENKRLAALVNAEVRELEAGADLETCQQSLRAAVKWLTEEVSQ